VNRRIAPEAAHAFVVRLYEACRIPSAAARAVADHLVDASLAGLPSHGILRAPDYLDHVDAGLVDPHGEPVVVRDDGTRVLLDGARTFGQLAAARAADLVAVRAREHGLALVTVARAGHLGRIGAYVEQLADDGLLALAFCSVPTRYHNVAWYGTREGCLGTNPIAYAVPTAAEPVVADFSTSAVPEGRIRSLRNQALAAPPDVLCDADGRPTTDPAALYADPPGAIQPLGGAQGHKGSALGLLVEVFGTLLAGERVDDAERENNLTLLALVPPPGFEALATGLVEHVRSATPVDPTRRTMVPGEPEHRARAAATAVEIDPVTWDRLAARAAAHGVALPPVEA
jgi:L-lactate dehydrogenase